MSDSTGWNVEAELVEALDALSQPPPTKRAPEVPPPTRRFEYSADLVGAPSHPADDLSPEPEVLTVTQPQTRTPVPTRRRGRKPNTTSYVPSTVMLPASLIDRLMIYRLEQMSSGSRFWLNEWMNAAVMALPSSGAGLERELLKHQESLNFGMKTKDPGRLPVRLLNCPLHEQSRKQVDRAMLEIYRRIGIKPKRQDIIGLAIAAALESAVESAAEDAS